MNSTAQLIAILLGFLCGSLMIAILIYTPLILKKRTLKKVAKAAQEDAQDVVKVNEYIPQELGYAFGALIVGFLFFTVAIFAYNALAHDTMVWFSVTGIIWYLVGFTAYALQKVLKERKNSGKL